MICRARFSAFLVVLLLLVSVGCRRSGETAASPAVASEEAAATSPAGGAPGDAGTGAAIAPAELTEADVEAFERGFAKEIEAVKAAQKRAASAATAVERAEAARAGWEDQTAPEGARAAGLPPERYRAVRETVTTVLETLDFQGKIEGPKSIDLERATPEMRARVARDPFTELTSASAAAIRARLDRLVPLWVEYVNLTAVAG